MGDVDLPAPAVELRAVTKRFRGAVAVDSVSLALEPGRVHALVGENGAGKSTLGKIIAGVHRPDEGELLVDGRAVSWSAPKEALAAGVAMMAQELVLAPNLTVAQNVYLGQERASGGWLRDGDTASAYASLCDRAGFHLPGDGLVGGMRTADQQKVELLRALARDASIIVMDEPTAALGAADLPVFYGIVRSLVAEGRTVILVSHFLTEVLELADTITVMRDGRVVTSSLAADESVDSLVEAMLGRSLDSTFPPKAEGSSASVVLRASGLATAHVRGIDLELRAGEVVGVAGLAGSGRSELVRALAGADPVVAGTVEVDDVAVDLTRGPAAAIDAGIVTIHESRKEQGLFLERSIDDNTSILSLRRLARLGWVRRPAERAACDDALARVDVRTLHRDARVGGLSGGNQQKVLFARSVLHGARVAVADEPTRGVDVGAKRAIYQLLRDLADGGAAVLFVSSEMEEVIGLADRVVVMRNGSPVAELSGDDVGEAAILAAAFGTPHESGAA